MIPACIMVAAVLLAFGFVRSLMRWEGRRFRREFKEWW